MNDNTVKTTDDVPVSAQTPAECGCGKFELCIDKPNCSRLPAQPSKVVAALRRIAFIGAGTSAEEMREIARAALAELGDTRS